MSSAIDKFYNKVQIAKLVDELFTVTLILSFIAGLCIYYGYYRVIAVLFCINVVYATYIDYKIKKLKIHMD